MFSFPSNSRNNLIDTKNKNLQKISYTPSYAIPISIRCIGIDTEIRKIKITISLCFEVFSQKYDDQPAFLAHDFLAKYLKKYWIGFVFLNPSDVESQAICNFHDWKYRHMIRIDNTNFANPTIENIALELYFCIKKLIDFFDHKLVSLSVAENFIFRTVHELSHDRNEIYRNSLLARWVESFYFSEMNKVNLRNRDQN